MLDGENLTAPLPEQRASPRLTMLIRTAKIISSSGEFLCVVRDASEGGLRVKTFHPLPVDVRVILELGSGERYAVEKIWEQGDSAGFRFEDPVDLERFVREAPPGLRKRQVRLCCPLAATLWSAGEPHPVVLRDISQQGAGVHCPKHLAMDERVRLEIENMPVIYAKVRWRRHGLFGLIFEETFRLDELARLTAPLQFGRGQGTDMARTAAGARR